jgi:hypothetical protein
VKALRCYLGDPDQLLDTLNDASSAWRDGEVLAYSPAEKEHDGADLAHGPARDGDGLAHSPVKKWRDGGHLGQAIAKSRVQQRNGAALVHGLAKQDQRSQ